MQITDPDLHAEEKGGCYSYGLRLLQLPVLLPYATALCYCNCHCCCPCPCRCHWHRCRHCRCRHQTNSDWAEEMTRVLKPGGNWVAA